MNNLLKAGLKQECNTLRLKANKIINQAVSLVEIVLGWVIMVGVSLCVALHTPNEGIYSLLGGLFVIFLFLVGSQFVANGVDRLEEASREKTVGELLKDLPLIQLAPGEQPPRVYY